MKAGFIGAGKVGFSLGKFMSLASVRVTGYYSLHEESAAEAAEFTGTRSYTDLGELICDSDVIFITVPDGVLSSVYEEVIGYEIAGKYLCHCSGLLSAGDVFADIDKYGAYGCSIHPLFPFSSKYDSYKGLQDAFFCLEGNITDEMKAMIESLGVNILSVDGHNKKKYHAACAIASNLVCGIEQIALELLNECGFDSKEAMAALSPLLKYNLEHILKDGPVMALSGPVERGDADTVRNHLESIEDNLNLTIYRFLSEKILSMAKMKNPERNYDALEQILSK